MLTLKLISEETERVIKGLEKKHFNGAREAIEKVLEYDKIRRESQKKLDANKQQQNQLSKQIGGLMKEGKKDEATKIKEEVAQLKADDKALQEVMEKAQHDMTEVLLTIPNIPNDDVPEGKDASDNVVVKEGGVKPELGPDALCHWDLLKKYNLVDFDLGVKITGAGFPVYIGKMARFQRALEAFFLDEARKAGYLEIQPPYVVNEASGLGTGQLPDKEGQMYHANLDNLYLIPTAEVPVTNIYRDVILDEKDLPIKRCAYSACFRREAGSYGKDVGHLPRAPVRQGGDRTHRHSAALLRVAQGDAGPRRGTAAEAGAPLSHPPSLRWRHELHLFHLLRLRDLERRPGPLARGKLRV